MLGAWNFFSRDHSLEFVRAELLVNHLPDDFVGHDGHGGGGVRSWKAVAVAGLLIEEKKKRRSREVLIDRPLVSGQTALGSIQQRTGGNTGLSELIKLLMLLMNLGGVGCSSRGY